MTTGSAEQLQLRGYEPVLDPFLNYRTAEIGTSEYFMGLQARWKEMRIHSYPEIQDPVDAEAFARSFRCTGDLLCAPETVDALLHLAQNDPNLAPGHPAVVAIEALDGMFRAIDNYKASRLKPEDYPNTTERPPKPLDDATALAGMFTDFYLGGNNCYADYIEAYNALRKFGTEYLTVRLCDIPEGDSIPRYEEGEIQERNLREVVTRAILKNTELEQGVGFNEEFITDLESTQALVLSLDINGATFTLPDQVTPNPILASIVNQLIHQLRQEYADTFPGRRAYIIPNTGMAGNYARGVIETAGPLIPDAVFGESGGVEVVRNGDATGIELTLDHLDMYLWVLRQIKQNILRSVQNTEAIVTAPKDSMISLMVRNERTDAPLLFTEDGTPMTEEVINSIMEQTKDRILRDIDDSAQREIIKCVLDNIELSYNPAVKFVDIHHAGVSKFSALNKFCKQRGLEEKDATVVHIGDSTVDSPNDGEAPLAYIVALANSKPKHAEKTASRGHRGLATRNDAIIGVITTIKGMINALQEIRRRRSRAKTAVA
jgi:hypothetical protein